MKISVSFKANNLLKTLRLTRRSLVARSIKRHADGGRGQDRAYSKVKEQRHERGSA